MIQKEIILTKNYVKSQENQQLQESNVTCLTFFKKTKLLIRLPITRTTAESLGAIAVPNKHFLLTKVLKYQWSIFQRRCPTECKLVSHLFVFSINLLDFKAHFHVRKTCNGKFYDGISSVKPFHKFV